jgi:putative oxidoreductase
MFEEATPPGFREALGEWLLRGGIALIFVMAGAAKFTSDPNSEWIKLFQQIGFGQWFRYFTGVVEILGGVLVLFSRSITVGLLLLAVTMLSAALILVFVVGNPVHCLPSSALFLGPVVYGSYRRSL